MTPAQAAHHAHRRAEGDALYNAYEQAEIRTSRQADAIRWARAMSRRVPGVQFIGLVGSRTTDGTMYPFENGREVEP